MNAVFPVETLVTEHLDLWSAALKRKSTAGRGSSSKVELYGIKKLRELILELAVRGLLVPQDPNDEPASELLKRIAVEKAKLVKEGKIKKDKPLPPIAAGEAPFAIPAGWALTRLADVINVLNGRAYKKHEMLPEGTPILRVGNLFTSNEWYFSDLELEPEKYIDDGDLIYAWSASFGPFIWQGGKVIYHYHIWKMEFFSKADVDKFYFRHYLQAISASIKASGNGIAMIHMTKERMEKLVLPIPPLEEQHRIVAKVDELMALCDQLEQQTDASLGAHQTLVETLLSALTSAADHAQFASAWQRIAGHFDTLFTTEESIAQLKQTILQLAVMGKLVSQDYNDASATNLCEPDEALGSQSAFDIPHGWAWTRLSNLAEINGGFAFKSTDYKEEGTRVVRISDFDEFGFKDHKVVRHPYTSELGKFALAQNNILMAMTGGTVGKSYFVKFLPEPMIVNQRVATIKVSACASPSYIDIVIRSEMTQEVIWNAKNSTNDNISMGDIKGFAIPLPPLSEQHRIVAKVDELMALCDQLKSRLNDAQTTQLHLADALVEQAIG